MSNIHDFVKQYENNERKIGALSDEILFLKGIDTNPNCYGGYNTTKDLPVLFGVRIKGLIRFKSSRLEAEMKLTTEDKEALIKVRQDMQEPLFAIRKELEGKINDV